MLQFACHPAVLASRILLASGRVPAILVVENEPLLLELTVEVLEEEGCHVLAAASAEEALALMSEATPDLLFTDIDLGPGLNGIALARAARAVLPDLPVIYASGGRPGLSPGEGVAGSIFLPKPYRPYQICSLIGQLLDQGGSKAAVLP